MSTGICTVKSVASDSTDGSSLEYKYDASGNRTYKAFLKDGATTRTWYSRDVQGNPLAIYSDNGSNQVYWKEQQLYGSSRLGMWMPEMVVNGGTTGNAATLWGQTNLIRYELSNHLGNIMATISDAKTGTEATVFSATDYAPFGMQMIGRKWNLSGGYRYGFDGKENDNEVKGEGNQQDYGMRVYDPRIGKFLSVDPMTAEYPELTPYQFASNRPIQAIDLDGLEAYFNNSGDFIKWGDDKSKTAPVIFLDNDKSVQLKSVNISQFINRVHWAYGEGGGTAADYFASTINNASQTYGEEGMYVGMTTKSKRDNIPITADNQKKIYFYQSMKSANEDVNPNYKRFNKIVGGKI